MDETNARPEQADPPRRATPVITVCSLTEPERAMATGSVLVDLDHGIQLSFDILAEENTLLRTVHDCGSMLEQAIVPMPYECVTCSLREQITQATMSWAEYGRPIILALPPTVEPATIVHTLQQSAENHGRISVAQVISVVEAPTFEDDLFGDDLLVELDLASSDSDRRAIGEVLAHQVEFADVVASETAASGRVAAILDHLLGPDGRHAELHRLDPSLVSAPRPVEAAVAESPVTCGGLALPWRGNPSYATPTGAVDREGIWTLELRSERPFSPSRLRAEIAAIGGGRVRSRGHFWVATRPELRCGWDGTGGQLSIGPTGPWHEAAETHLVVTGSDRDPDEIRTAFRRALLTDDELRAGVSLQDDDGLEPWLGSRAETH